MLLSQVRSSLKTCSILPGCNRLNRISVIRIDMMIELIVFGLSVSTVIGGLLGNLKGSFSTGAVLGLLLGPLGWLLVFAIPDQRPKCPECFGSVIDGARRCKNCGASLPVNQDLHQKQSTQYSRGPERHQSRIAIQVQTQPMKRKNDNSNHDYFFMTKSDETAQKNLIGFLQIILFTALIYLLTRNSK